jgi:uncharacterized protein
VTEAVAKADGGLAPAVDAPHNHLPTLVRRHPLIAFFALTYLVSWSLWIPLVVLGDRTPAPLELVLRMLGSLVPSTIGVVIVAVLHGKPGVRTLLGRLLKGRVGPRWYLAVLVLPLLVPLGLGVSVLLGGASPEVDATIVSALALFVLSIFPGSALGEEIGWRGFALPHLQAGHSALSASFVLGVLWGCWHLPLWLAGIKSYPASLYPAFVVTVIAASVMSTWMYNSTGGSLLIVVLYHAAANLPLTLLVTPLEARMTQPFVIYAALMVAAAIAVVVIAGPDHLSRTSGKQLAGR